MGVTRGKPTAQIAVPDYTLLIAGYGSEREFLQIVAEKMLEFAETKPNANIGRLAVSKAIAMSVSENAEGDLTFDGGSIVTVGYLRHLLKLTTPKGTNITEWVDKDSLEAFKLNEQYCDGLVA